MPTEKNIKSPEMLLDYFEAYKTDCKSAPKKENFWSHRRDKEVSLSREVPLTWNGFEIWLRKNKIITRLEHYKANKDNRYIEYMDIVRAIGQEIYEDKFVGAVVGIYNPSIIVRELGLSDKKDLTSSDGSMATKPQIVVQDEQTAKELETLISNLRTEG